MKPYELWKQYIVTSPETVKLGQNRSIKLDFDQSSKAHLTSVKGAPNRIDYKSQNKVFHGKAGRVDKSHIDLDLGVHKLMKTTNYQIGKEGENPPNEITSTTQTTHVPLGGNGPNKGDRNLRRADPDNPNRILTVGFGFGAEKGTSEHQVVHRGQGYYNHLFSQK